MLKGKPFEISILEYKMAGRKEEWKKLLSRLESAFRGNECKFIVILGGYGLGKTYTIEKIYREFKKNKKLFKDVFIIRTTLTETPIRVYPGEPSKPKFGLDFVNRIFKHIEFDVLMKITKKLGKKLSTRSLKINDLSYKFFKKIQEGERAAYNVLAGIPMNASDIRKVGLVNIRDSQTALELLFDFQKILKAAGYNNFLILLDEFEYIPTLSTPKVTIILNTFRTIFDHYGVVESREPNTMAKVVFVFAISPGGWRRINELEASAIKRTGGGGIAPFLSRVNPIDIINLGPLTPDEIKELIEYRLQEHRIKTRKVPHPLYPFTEECIRFISEKSQGVPRRALQFCGIILEDAYEKGVEKITSKYAKRVLEELNLL